MTRDQISKSWGSYVSTFDNRRRHPAQSPELVFERTVASATLPTPPIGGLKGRRRHRHVKGDLIACDERQARKTADCSKQSLSRALCEAQQTRLVPGGKFIPYTRREGLPTPGTDRSKTPRKGGLCGDPTEARSSGRPTQLRRPPPRWRPVAVPRRFLATRYHEASKPRSHGVALNRSRR